jgi:predicted NUDIX family NTP pyrophosphohydrolase
MTAKRSAGILLFRHRCGATEVLLGHMGGPFWQSKDIGAWSIPKGEYAPPEEPLAAAFREFREELGVDVPPGPLSDLGEVKQAAKRIQAWAIEADLDPRVIVPGRFEMEWPPRSGRRASFEEIDRVSWFDLPTAGDKIVAGQRALLERLARQIGQATQNDSPPANNQ